MTKIKNVCVGVMTVAVFMAGPAQAGFELITPATSGAAFASSAISTDPSLPPMTRPGVVVDDRPMGITPEPIADLPVIPAAPVAEPARPAAQPVRKNVRPAPPAAPSRPMVITARPEQMPPAEIPQIATSAVYPPPSGGPAAPLTGKVTIQKGQVPDMPRRNEGPEVQKTPMPKGPVQQITPVSQPARAQPIVDTQPASAPAVIDGFGHAIPLSLAMDQIVPKGVDVVYDVQPDMNMIVSWAGGRPWPDVLSDMLYAHGYRVNLNGAQLRILRAGNTQPSSVPVSSGPAPAPQPMKVVEVDSAPVAVPPLAAATPTPVPIVSYAPSPAELDVTKNAPIPASTDVAAPNFDAKRMMMFEAQLGEALPDVLARWSAAAGVQLYWQGPEGLRIRKTISYQMTYLRAVERLMAEYNTNTPRPAAKLHPNAPSGPAVLAVTKG